MLLFFELVLQLGLKRFKLGLKVGFGRRELGTHRLSNNRQRCDLGGTTVWCDDATANHAVIIIKDCRLARGTAGLWSEKLKVRESLRCIPV